MTPPTQDIIRIDGFSFRFGRKPILDGVSFSVARGESVAIVGPNGAGKTTLIKCLDALFDGFAGVSQSGTIEIDGRPIGGYSRKQLARLVSYVPQADGHLAPFSVEQFITMARYPHLGPFSPAGGQDMAVVHETMERTDTARFAGRLLESLSGGERQSVYIAAAIAQGAKIMLLDEPTTFLDYRHQDDVRRLLAKTASDDGLTMISVTHDVNRAALESDRIVALREGRVAFIGRPDEIMKPDVLQRIYDTPFLMADHPRTGLPVIVPSGSRDV
jgi:iron complex transport system ATP-binding protein